jgi:adenylosuccinate synthase
MNSNVVLGCIWGDEGKAKIVDVLAGSSDVIVRFQGGSNAGHTVKSDSQTLALHLIPSGILYPNKLCLLGRGTVIDPFELLSEMESLKHQGISFKGRFFIDSGAGIVLPIHKILDSKKEESGKQTKIGTTKKGIGPCYSDIISRVGIRFSDLFDEIKLKEKLLNLYQFHELEAFGIDNLMSQLKAAKEQLAGYICQASYMLDRMYSDEKTILFEGAQGSLLDIYFGSYPFVTSSHTIAGGVSAGSGFPPNKIDNIVGVYKSYFTRVGAGPFPTELNDATGDLIRKNGNEYGTTTGRPRRCGWFDAVLAKYTAMINGIDDIALTLLDVLSGMETLKICTGYKLNGELISEVPINIDDLDNVAPQYIELPGWKEDITEAKSYEELPVNAKKYIRKIEELLNTDVTIISIGPDRGQTIFRSEKFSA